VDSVASVIAAVAALATAVGGLILAVLQVRVKRSVAEVHTMVNQQRTDAARYTAVLVAALRDQGLAVPDDESLDTNTQH
jgi:phage-related tail protein